MKKIAIFGATGMTGLCTVEAALKLGLEVRALLRDPSRMPEELRKQVEVVTGDVLVKEDVDKVVEGRDAIVVTLGTRNDLAPTTIMSDGLRNILSAMEKNNATKSLNWIAVMPPHIAGTPSGDYSVEIGSSPGRAISKFDLGKFMIECLSKPEYYKQRCGLATKVPAP
ncbi:flavin reductase (NADPH), partial [Aphis craccivora]